MTYNPVLQFKADRVVLSEDNILFAKSGKVWLTPRKSCVWMHIDTIEKGLAGKSIRMSRHKDIIYFRDYWNIATSEPKCMRFQEIENMKTIFPWQRP